MINYINEGPVKLDKMPTSYWCSHGEFSIYCRRSFRVIGGVRHTAFILANVQCPEKCRGKGDFKKLLPVIEREVARCGYSVLSFESVLNHRFASYLEKQGYVADATSYLLANYDKVMIAQVNDSCYNGDAIALL